MDRVRDKIRIDNDFVKNFLAEFLGTFALVVFGDGAVAQVVLGSAVKDAQFFGGFLNICFGYGFALMIGILISGGVSGGHLNPAVTSAMLLLGKINPIQVPVYFIAQFLGAFVAALVLWGVYADALYIYEMSVLPAGTNYNGYTMATAGIFASYPMNAKITTSCLAMDQILGTALLVIIILAVTDENNMKVPGGLVPLLIGLGLCAIHISFGLNAGAAINPARDFAPRLMTLMGGWGNDTFKMKDYWFWIPTFMPFIGGPLGGLIYYLGVEAHHPEKI
eukprot:TRINITY_DN9333_c0_g1_i2.p1 TRINITY_DN9333_c0_g1~~TRINITY_DN9333_c0_g1_i2.p1  ORF type:complete len:278 (-),score=67.89 TRINITY_DN9333_c0_g1_i2:332-1165(-)